MTHDNHDDKVPVSYNAEESHDMIMEEQSNQVDAIIDDYKISDERQHPKKDNDNDKKNVTIDGNEEEDEEDEEYDDSDFGTFDDVSFDEFEEPAEESKPINSSEEHVNYLRFTEDTFKQEDSFHNSVNNLMELLFPVHTTEKIDKPELQGLLNKRSAEVFEELSSIPHLKPPNWIKSKIRHNLLIELGIPINLDEISDDHHAKTHPIRQKTNNINTIEENIDWKIFDIRKESNLSANQKTELIEKTTEILSKIETDNLTNSTKQYLESSSEELIDAKLAEFNNNYKQLIELGSIWFEHYNGLKENFEVYENVIQNLIGYSQKLRREEIFENLSKLKSKTKKGKKS